MKFSWNSHEILKKFEELEKPPKTRNKFDETFWNSTQCQKTFEQYRIKDSKTHPTCSVLHFSYKSRATLENERHDRQRPAGKRTELLSSELPPAYIREVPSRNGSDRNNWSARDGSTAAWSRRGSWSTGVLSEAAGARTPADQMLRTRTERRKTNKYSSQTLLSLVQWCFFRFWLSILQFFFVKLALTR